MKTLRFSRRYVLSEMLVLLALFATPVRADREGDFTFNRNGATAWLTGYVGPGGAVIIPDRLGNLPVANIGIAAFLGRTGLTSVTIPSSVTSIGAYAFEACTGLMSAYFKGNAPETSIYVFLDFLFLSAFHRAGAAGWSSAFANRPTAVWMPRPAFGDWALSMGLAAQCPNASAEGDDPDGDSFTNGYEWFAATDPTQRASRLELQLTPRAADLSASDQTPIKPGQHAVYLRSVPGYYYGVQRATSLGGAWELQATKVAATTQTRFVLPRPVDSFMSCDPLDVCHPLITARGRGKNEWRTRCSADR